LKELKAEHKDKEVDHLRKLLEQANDAEKQRLEEERK
jgi:hypothetical protein